MTHGASPAALRIAIIADDLTGALDAAGPFASRGAPTWVLVDHGDCSPALFPGAHVVSVNTASRHSAAPDAAASVMKVMSDLQPLRAEIVLKKIDSTLRGNVAAETLAALAASGRSNAIVAPAFPPQGRTMRAGVVHVGGLPLAQTGFARDALSPPPLEPLHEVFRRDAPQAIVLGVGPGGPFELARPGEPPRVFVVDSENIADLRRAVGGLSGRLGDCLLVGSAGLAAAVAEFCIQSSGVPAPPRTQRQILMAVGSRAEQSADQIECLRRREGARVLAAPNGLLSETCAGLDDPLVVLRATPGEDGREGDPAEVATLLARSALRIIERGRADVLLATGGDTAIAVLHALHQPSLQVMGDLLPGIPYCRLERAGRPLWLITKAGGFGTRETLVEIVQLLRAA